MLVTVRFTTSVAGDHFSFPNGSIVQMAKGATLDEYLRRGYAVEVTTDEKPVGVFPTEPARVPAGAVVDTPLPPLANKRGRGRPKKQPAQQQTEAKQSSNEELPPLDDSPITGDEPIE